MRIGIIGAGNVGYALGTGWIRAGHDVTFGIRDPQSPPSQGPARARYASVATAVQGAEATVLAVPWPAVSDVLAAAGDLTGKLLIDCTNPLHMGAGGLELEIGHSTSGGEHVAALVPGASDAVDPHGAEPRRPYDAGVRADATNIKSTAGYSNPARPHANVRCFCRWPRMEDCAGAGDAAPKNGVAIDGVTDITRCR